MSPNITPTRFNLQVTTPSRPEKPRPIPELRPQDIIARQDLVNVINDEVQFAQEKIVPKIDYVLNELKTETSPERRRQGFALLQRLQRDDLADCNAKIEAFRRELTLRDRALNMYEREAREGEARRGDLEGSRIMESGRGKGRM